MRNFVVKDGTLLQDFLFTALKDLKKTKIKQILKFGSVHVNGHEVTWYKHPLKPGDKVEIIGKEQALAERSKANLGIPILFEDKDLLVVEKPSGLLTMGTEREKEATLYFMLNEYEKSKTRDKSGRIYIVHRLDRDASGLIVFAKNDASKRGLQSHWNLATKKYYAITEGTPEEKEGTIENFLREDDFKRVYAVSRNHPEAQHAVTHYRVLRENGGYALLEVTLETGRKNQIRVHLSGLGCPIMGDEKYGARSDPFRTKRPVKIYKKFSTALATRSISNECQCRRLALHACFLSFPHPMTGELKTFKSPLPVPFKKIFPEAKN